MNCSRNLGLHFRRLASMIQLEGTERIDASSHWRRNYSPDYQGSSPLVYSPLDSMMKTAWLCSKEDEADGEQHSSGVMFGVAERLAVLTRCQSSSERMVTAILRS